MTDLTVRVCTLKDAACVELPDAEKCHSCPLLRVQRAADFDSKVRRHGYADRVTGERIYDPDALGVEGSKS